MSRPKLHRLQDQSTREPSLDARRQAQVEALKREAQRTREFVAAADKRRNRKGQELKSNVTDNDSAKMATSKGVIQGYAAQAAVDARHQVIVAADVLGSGSEQAALLPMIELSSTVRGSDTLITADAGYHSTDNVNALCDQGIPALIADGQMRKRDERFKDQTKHKDQADPLHDKQAGDDEPTKRLFRPADFEFDPGSNTAVCPAGQLLISNGSTYTANGWTHQKFIGQAASCQPCALRSQCLRHPDKTAVRQVALYAKKEVDPTQPIEVMKRAIDSTRGRQLYSRRIGTVEPVFANVRHHKRLNRFTLRGHTKVNTQWHLYCLVHNIEKMATAPRTSP